MPLGSAGSEFAWTWVAIAEAGDRVLAPGRIDAADFHELAERGLPIPGFVDQLADIDSIGDAELVPWGWTDSVRNRGARQGWRCPAPAADVVRRVNSREFRFALERAWGLVLPGADLAASPDDLERALAARQNWPRGWLLKANFGMSGRESLRGHASILDAATRNWALKRFVAGPIVVEPVVERVAEAGIQIEIPRDGSPEIVGVTPLLTDRSGVYRGSRFGCPESEIERWRPAVAVALRTAAEIAGLGYFGPLGVDAMLYRDETAQVRLRALQDVNARYTMGRLVLGFRRILPAGWCGSWLHFRSRQVEGVAIIEWLRTVSETDFPEGAVALRASPETIGSHPAKHHALLVLAPTAEVRARAEQAIFRTAGWKG